MNVTISKAAGTHRQRPSRGIEGANMSAALLLADQQKFTSPDLLAAATTDLSITVKNGVATLSGCTDSAAESHMAEYLVSRLKGVDTVINLIACRSVR